MGTFSAIISRHSCKRSSSDGLMSAQSDLCEGLSGLRTEAIRQPQPEGLSFEEQVLHTFFQKGGVEPGELPGGHSL